MDFREIENTLVLRLYLETKNEDGSANYDGIRDVASQSFAAGGVTTQLAESLSRLLSVLALDETVVPDSKVGDLLGTLDPNVNIGGVAYNLKHIFDVVKSVDAAVLPAVVSEDDAFLFAMAIAVAGSSVIAVAAESKGIETDALAAALLEQFGTVPPQTPIFEFHEEPFSPGSYTFDVEKIIRLNSEFEDHNIEALKTKSFTNTKDSNLSFADMSRSLAAFVWAVNRTIDIHKDETFVYDFSRLGTEHVERISRSWGIKEIDLLKETIETVMKGIGSIYDSTENDYHFAIPSLEGEDYLKFRYVFNVAMASISSAHVYLFSTNFDSTQSGVYGEVRRTIKEVQDSRAQSA